MPEPTTPSVNPGHTPRPSTTNASDGTSSSSPDGPTKPLMDFLTDGKSDQFFDRLYESEAVCLGIFRLLPPLSRQIIMNLLWLSSEMNLKSMRLFLGLDPNIAGQAGLIEIQNSNPLLLDLQLLQTTKSKGIIGLELNGVFKRGLRGGICGGGSNSAFGVTYKPSEDASSSTTAKDGRVDVEIDELVAYGDGCWESLLKYMVSSQKRAAREDETPEPRVLDLLLSCGLMERMRDDHHRLMTDLLKITSKGFQFLLEDRSAQVWQILMYYIKEGMEQEGRAGLDGVEVLKLLFTLSNMQLGRAYDASRLPPMQRRVLDELEAFGLIYRRADTPKGKHPQFYPTGLSTTLCSGTQASGGDGVMMTGSGGAGTSEMRKGFLVLETNYKVYAYTSNELEIAILNLFIDIRTRYPNLIVGRLERDTVKEAMKNGITATQIISYLTTHAHPQMYKNNPLLPITVVDQLHLWDRERNRLDKNQAALFRFWRKDMYEDSLAYAETIAALLWTTTTMENAGGADKIFSGIIVVHESLSAPFKTYVDQRRDDYRLVG